MEKDKSLQITITDLIFCQVIILIKLTHVTASHFGFLSLNLTRLVVTAFGSMKLM